MAAVLQQSAGSEATLSPFGGVARVKLDFTYKPDDFTLICTVGQAANLPAMDSNGFSDPYVILALKGLHQTFKRHQTRVEVKTLNPKFNQTFEFKLSRPAADPPGTWRLHVALWDRDWLSEDDYLGGMSFPLEDLMIPSPQSGWFVLLSKEEALTAYEPFTVERRSTVASLRHRSKSSMIHSVPCVTFDQSMFKGLPKVEKERQLAIRELIETEETYVKHISVCVKSHPKSQMCEVVDKETYYMMVGQLDEIKNMTQSFLDRLSELPQVIDMFGQLMIDYLPTVEQLYSHYMENNHIVEQRLAELGSNPAFAALLRKGSDNSLRLDLRSFRLEPMQRITRYPLLLAEILRHTPRDHPDFDDMVSAHRASLELTHRVNERTRHSEMRSHLLSILRHLDSRSSYRHCLDRATTKLTGAFKFRVKRTAKARRLAMNRTRTTVTNAHVILADDEILGPSLLVATSSDDGAEWELMTDQMPLTAVEFTFVEDDPTKRSEVLQMLSALSVSASTSAGNNGNSLAGDKELVCVVESKQRVFDPILLYSDADSATENMRDAVTHLNAELSQRVMNQEDMQDIALAAQKLLTREKLSEFESLFVKAASAITALQKELESSRQSMQSERDRSREQLQSMLQVVRTQERLRRHSVRRGNADDGRSEADKQHSNAPTPPSAKKASKPFASSNVAVVRSPLSASGRDSSQTHDGGTDVASPAEGRYQGSAHERHVVRKQAVAAAVKQSSAASPVRQHSVVVSVQDADISPRITRGKRRGASLSPNQRMLSQQKASSPGMQRQGTGKSSFVRRSRTRRSRPNSTIIVGPESSTSHAAEYDRIVRPAASAINLTTSSQDNTEPSSSEGSPSLSRSKQGLVPRTTRV